jgi:large subunit ribosomal protein L25
MQVRGIPRKELMEEIVLKAKHRDIVGKQVNALRRAGGLPAVIYGSDIQPVAITLDAHDASRLLASITSSHVIVVDVEGTRHNALVKERQRHPIQGNLLHVDFQAVSLTRKLRADVFIALEGEPSAVRDRNGVLVTGIEALEVECFPQNLPERITVDVSVLSEVGSAIYVRDLEIPPDVEVLTDPNEMIALVTSQAAEEIEEVEEVEEAEEEPEVIERGKQEEEEY